MAKKLTLRERAQLIIQRRIDIEKGERPYLNQITAACPKITPKSSREKFICDYWFYRGQIEGLMVARVTLKEEL